VCLIGRNHPFGIVLASILFGILYQGGAELSFDFPNIDREMIQVVQALVVLFSGALSLMLVKPTERLFVYLDEKKKSNNTRAAEA
jgi:simple sugar transport system permease protein